MYSPEGNYPSLMQPLLPPPPGFEPPELSLKFLVLSVLFMVVMLFGAACLAAVQSERKQTKGPRKPDTDA